MWKERRHFSRYSKSYGFDLEVGGGRFGASTIDYSLDGFGASLSGTPEVEIGDTLSITIDELGMRGAGRVVWKCKTPGGMKLGVTRVGSLGGQLRNFPIADVLIGFQRSQRSGILYITSGKVQVKLYLSRGDITFAISNRPEDSCGMVLVHSGLMGMTQLQQAQDIQRLTKKRPQDILIEMGAASADTVNWAVGISVENIIYSLFNLREGQFLLKEEAGDQRGDFRIQLSTANLIYRGIMGIKDKEHIASFKPAPNSVPYVSDDPLDLFQGVALTDKDRAILTRCDGHTSVADIIAATPNDELHVIKVLYALVHTRLIDYWDAPVEESGEEHGYDHVAQADECVSEEEDFVREVKTLHLNYKSLGYYGVLGVDKKAAKPVIKKAFYAKAKQFHPDRHFGQNDDIQDKLNEIFTYITGAYNTLMDDFARAKYDGKDTAPADLKEDPKAYASHRFEEGRLALKEARLNDAVQAFSEALYYVPAMHQFAFGLGVAQYRLGNYKEAETAYRKALSLDPLNPQYLAEAGHVFLALGYPVRARGNFEKALQYNPNEKRAIEGMRKIPPKR